MPPHKHVGWFGSQKGGTHNSSVMLENETRYTQLSEGRRNTPGLMLFSSQFFGDFCILAHFTLLFCSNA